MAEKNCGNCQHWDWLEDRNSIGLCLDPEALLKLETHRTDTCDHFEREPPIDKVEDREDA